MESSKAGIQMISTPRQLSPPVGAAFAAGASVPADFYSSPWGNIGRVAEVAVWDAANRAKDRSDEALDAMRVSNGMTLDQFLESVTR